MGPEASRSSLSLCCLYTDSRPWSMHHTPSWGFTPAAPSVWIALPTWYLQGSALTSFKFLLKCCLPHEPHSDNIGSYIYLKMEEWSQLVWFSG